MKIGVTTAIKPSEEMVTKAIKVSQDLNLMRCERKKKSISKILNENSLDYVFIVQKDKLLLKNNQNELFWHPGTSVIKVWDKGQGGSNLLLEATRLSEGDTVLDCTFGYGSDAIVMASAVGKNGAVIGLETNPYLAYLAQDGLRNYKQVSEDVQEAMNRIEVIHSNYKEYLCKLDSKSVDLVYFDPMFQNPQKASKSLNAIRDFADMSTLERSWVDEALRVCRKRVVVKERIGSGVFKKLGITNRIGEIRMGAVVYGILEKNDDLPV